MTYANITPYNRPATPGLAARSGPEPLHGPPAPLGRELRHLYDRPRTDLLDSQPQLRPRPLAARRRQPCTQRCGLAHALLRQPQRQPLQHGHSAAPRRCRPRRGLPAPPLLRRLHRHAPRGRRLPGHRPLHPPLPARRHPPCRPPGGVAGDGRRPRPLRRHRPSAGLPHAACPAGCHRRMLRRRPPHRHLRHHPTHGHPPHGAQRHPRLGALRRRPRRRDLQRHHHRRRHAPTHHRRPRPLDHLHLQRRLRRLGVAAGQRHHPGPCRTRPRLLQPLRQLLPHPPALRHAAPHPAAAGERGHRPPQRSPTAARWRRRHPRSRRNRIPT